MLSIIPWMKSSSSAEDFKTVSAGSFLAVLALGAGVHLVYLAGNYPVSKYILKLELPELKAETIITSKSSPTHPTPASPL